MLLLCGLYVKAKLLKAKDWTMAPKPRPRPDTDKAKTKD